MPPLVGKNRLRPIIRVFVSSTFKDLVLERNALQDHVWPELERYCLLRGFQFQAIDLRWGVSTGAGLDHRTTRICLEELRRSQEISCRPNFLILLGDRYGWRPLPEEITPGEFDSLKAAAADNKAHLRILEDWYRLDRNSRPPIHLLRSRHDSPDGQDYTKNADGDTPAWTSVQDVLWSLINGAFPPSMLAGRFAEPISQGDPIPTIVRFQGSATEREIWRGAFGVAEAAQHVLAFSREIANLDAMASHWRLGDFVDVKGTTRIDRFLHDAVLALKAQLREMLGENYLEAPQRATLQMAADQSGEPCLEISTDHLEFLCKQVRNRLIPIIQEQIDAYDRVPEIVEGALLSGEVLRDLKRERDEHERFAAERAPQGVFVGRELEKAKILTYLSSASDRHFIVHGVSGSGKSALLAFAAREAAAKSGAILLQRFLGITKRSSDLSSLLIDLCQELREQFPLADELPTDVRLLAKEFWEQLKNATVLRPIYVFLDALDQLDPADDAHSLWWIRPIRLPSHVKFVLSCLSDPDDKAPCGPLATLEQPGFLTPADFVAIEHLDPEQARLLWTRWLGLAGRTLSGPQQAAVDARILAPQAIACRQPLYLKILFEEARLWRSYDPPPQLGASVPELLDSLFDRLIGGAAHGSLVEPALGYLASARYGLTETELLEILLCDRDYRKQLVAGAYHALPPQARRIPFVIWSRLRYDMAPYLAERGAPGGRVLHYYHRQVGSYVCQRFAGTPANRSRWHRRLARYFTRQPWWLQSGRKERERMRTPHHARPAHVRKITELPHQLLALAREANAAGLSTDADEASRWIERLFQKLPFLEAKNESGRGFELVRELMAAVNMLPQARPKRRILKLLAEALRRDIHFIARHPTSLFQCLWNQCWWYDSPDAGAHYLQPNGGCRAPPPWLLPGNQLFLLLERWRFEKEMREPGFLWLRSLRPPALNLGTAQEAILQGHDDHVSAVAFSPNKGQWIVSGSLDKTVRVWNVETGAEWAVLQGHQDGVNSVAFSLDGQWIVSGSLDKTLRVWNAATGAEGPVMRGHDSGVTSVAVSPDGRWIASGSFDRTVRIWDANTGTQRMALHGHESYVKSVAISADGQWIVSGSSDKTLRVWNAATGAEGPVMHGHDGDVKSVAVSPDGRWIASGSSDKTVRVWNAKTGAERSILCGHKDFVRSVAFSLDGRRIVSGSEDKTVRVWDAMTGEESLLLSGHLDYVLGVQFSPDGYRVVSGACDNTVRVWNLDMASEPMVLRGHEEWIIGIVLSQEGRRLASFSTDGTVRVWDVGTGAERAVLRGHDQSVQCMAISPDGRWIVSGSGDKTLRVWNAESGAEHAVLQDHDDWIHCVAISPDGQWIISGLGDKTVRVRDINTGEERHVLRGHEKDVVCVAISPDGRWIASGSQDKTVRVWDALAGTERAILRGHHYPVHCVTFSPDSRQIASGSGTRTDVSTDTTVRLWDAETGTERAIFRGHERTVSRIVFFPDGRQIVSESLSIHPEHRPVRIWDAVTGACLEAIHGNGDVAAIARGCRWRVLNRGQETVVEAADTGLPVAWLPLALWDITTISSGVRWAGGHKSYLCLFQLEGTTNDNPPSADNPPTSSYPLA